MPRLHQFAGLPLAGERQWWRPATQRRSPPAARRSPLSGLRSVPGRAFRAPAGRRKRLMPKLSDNQAVLLAASAARPDLSVLPVPATLKLKGAALERSLRAMLDRGLIAEAATTEPAAMDGADGEQRTPGHHSGRSRRHRCREPARRRLCLRTRPPARKNPEPQAARGRAASSGHCSMRSRARRGRRSKTCPPPRAGCRTPPAPPSPGSASAAMTCGSPRSGRARSITSSRRSDRCGTRARAVARMSRRRLSKL